MESVSSAEKPNVAEVSEVGAEGPPLIFETAVFDDSRRKHGERNRLDGGGRTSTLEDALAQHAATLAEIGGGA